MRRETGKSAVDHLNAILIDKGSFSSKNTFLLVSLRNSDGAGNGIANIDGYRKLKIHLRGEKADHTPNMRHHAGCEQAGDNRALEPAFLQEELVDVIGIVVASDTTEQRYIALGEGTAKGKGLPDLDRLKCFTKLLLKLFSCLRHDGSSSLDS